jgi:hypothetical protein
MAFGLKYDPKFYKNPSEYSADEPSHNANKSACQCDGTLRLFNYVSNFILWTYKYNLIFSDEELVRFYFQHFLRYESREVVHFTTLLSIHFFPTRTAPTKITFNRVEAQMAKSMFAPTSRIKAALQLTSDQIMNITLLVLERAKGIEPSYAAWEAAVLPLNYARVIFRIANGLRTRQARCIRCQALKCFESFRLCAW